MKQREFDKMVKEEIAHFEKTAKPDWNKDKIFSELTQVGEKSTILPWKKRYAIAAIIALLIGLNLYHFFQFNILQNGYEQLNQTNATISQEHMDLMKKIEDKEVYIANYKSKVNALAKEIKSKDEKIANLESTLEKNISAKEIQFITKYVHDTVYIEQEITTYLAQEKQPKAENIVTKEKKKETATTQYLNAYKPLLTSGNDTRNKIKVKLGSDNINGHKQSEPFNLLSADL